MIDQDRALRLARRASIAFVTGAVIYASTVHVGYLHDGQRYSELASHPFHNQVGSPWSLRIAVPLLVHVLPFTQSQSFYGLAIISLVITGLFVAATVAELGLPERHACAAAMLVCSSELTVISFWAYYVDVEVLAFFAGVLYFAVRRRSWLLVPLVAIGMPLKEIAALAAPLAGFVWGRARRPMLISACALVVAALVFVLETHLLPTKGAVNGINAVATHGNVLHTQWRYTTYWLGVVWRFGIFRYGANAMLSVFGVVWLAWPVGFLRAPAWLRRAQLWVLLALPLFITAQWERSFALYLPVLIPVFMLGLREWKLPELVALTVGSAWVSGVAPSQTITDDKITSATTKLTWMSPGFALALAAVGLFWMRSRAPGALAEPTLPEREPG